jgi:hypothetical protein
VTQETQEAAAVAARIDISTSAGHNLLALLLLLLGGDDWSGTDIDCGLVAYGHAERQGLVKPFGNPDPLTELGRKVAELLRPKPWTAALSSPVTGCRPMLFGPDSLGVARFISLEVAQRVAGCMTAEAERNARAYKGEAGS